MKQKLILVGGATIYKKVRGKTLWFIVKQKEESPWELAKTNARRGESSVRATIRMLGEEAAMSVKVLEEVGRGGGAVLIAGKTIPQRQIYYLILMKDAKEILGFIDSDWLEYAKAIKKLTSKKDIAMLKAANQLLKEIERKKKKK